MKRIRRYLAALAVPLAVTGTAALAAGPAHAAPPVTYADTSLTAFPVGGDSITSLSAAYNGSILISASQAAPTTETTLAPTDYVQFTPDGTADTWSLAGGAAVTSGGLTFSVTPGGKLTATGTALAAAGASVTARVTDGTAVALDTLNVAPVTGGVALWVTPDTVELNNPFNDNANGEVQYSTVPAGAAVTESNLPYNLAAGNPLVPAGAVPGRYGSVTVTATDAAGAVAVQRDVLTVHGGEVRPDLPRLYGGHAVKLSPVRENVYFVQGGAASCDHFVIVGPGGINGHEGWVRAGLGLNTAVYGGLEAHHGYTVYYTPVVTSDPGSCAGAPRTPIPGTHWGYVYFVS